MWPLSTASAAKFRAIDIPGKAFPGRHFFLADFFFDFFLADFAAADFSVEADGSAFFFLPAKMWSQPPENLMLDPV